MKKFSIGIYRFTNSDRAQFLDGVDIEADTYEDALKSLKQNTIDGFINIGIKKININSFDYFVIVEKENDKNSTKESLNNILN